MDAIGCATLKISEKTIIFTSASPESIDDQWENYLCYDNLPGLARMRDVVRRSDNNDFFIIQHPTKSQVSGRKMMPIGWKLHISIDPSDLKKGFSFAAPIIAQYCFNFKVSIPEKIRGARLFEGAQITIYLNDVDGSVISQKDLHAMMAEVNEVFIDNNIRVGKKPDSDIPMEFDYFSIRNDKCISVFSDDLGYLAADDFGVNPNPLNFPNPFSQLVKSVAGSDVGSFDPEKHFRLFEADIDTPNLADMFYITMIACLNEYTKFDLIIQELRECRQPFLETINEFPGSFIKESYKDNPDIQIQVRQALRVIYFYETVGEGGQFAFYDAINAAKLSRGECGSHSFKKVLLCLEGCARELI